MALGGIFTEYKFQNTKSIPIAVGIDFLIFETF